eukprot:scaffold1018_cov59-Phaeocystis_antarctica.AAC.4
MDCWQQRVLDLGVPPTLPAQVVVQQLRACATDARARQPGEPLLGTLWPSHLKGPRRPRWPRMASTRRSSPASPRPRPTGGTAEPSGALSAYHGPFTPVQGRDTRLKKLGQHRRRGGSRECPRPAETVA